MNGEELLEKMEMIDPKFIEEASKKTRPFYKKWYPYVASAACLAIIFGVAITMNVGKHTNQSSYADASADYAADDVSDEYEAANDDYTSDEYEASADYEDEASSGTFTHLSETATAILEVKTVTGGQVICEVLNDDSGEFLPGDLVNVDGLLNVETGQEIRITFEDYYRDSSNPSEDTIYALTQE